MISRLALEINQNSDNSKGAGSWDAGFHFLTDIPWSQHIQLYYAVVYWVFESYIWWWVLKHAWDLFHMASEGWSRTSNSRLFYFLPLISTYQDFQQTFWQLARSRAGNSFCLHNRVVPLPSEAGKTTMKLTGRIQTWTEVITVYQKLLAKITPILAQKDPPGPTM